MLKTLYYQKVTDKGRTWKKAAAKYCDSCEIIIPIDKNLKFWTGTEAITAA